ncbi:MAG: hypothetical protein ACYDEO_18455 [Aggregatilineales bacterium]
MKDESLNGQQNDLFNLLAYTSGHLEITSSGDELALQKLQETLAKSLIHENISTAKNRFFSVENSDLFFPDALPQEQRLRLKNLADQVVHESAQADRRVFVRDVPVRTSQISGSVPAWASGAAVDETIGPFLNKDGRQVWYDFFKIMKLVALYVEGQADPAILFSVSLPKRFLIENLPLVTDILAHYHLHPDSIWINARLFASNAPAGFYMGIKIKGGDVTLSAPPQVINGMLTIAATTVATVRLDLDQPAVSDADPSSPYGVDARNAALQLPQQMTLHFAGTSGAIDSITETISSTEYGQSADFKWDAQSAPTYSALLNRVLIPLTCSATTFTISDCQSPFAAFAGTADIQHSAWGLPTAQIDIAKPSPAAGIGGLVIQCKPGMTAQWQGLQGGEINLPNPYILCDPGRINITDLQAGSVFCTQEYKLWKDAVNRFGSSVKIQYTAAFPFIYNTFANGNEAVMALVSTNPLLDRPVTVSGLPFDIHTKNSVLIVAVSKLLKLIYLFDDNILFDNYKPDQPKGTLPPPQAVALHNALFKVTPVNGCLLFGVLADDMVQVDKGIVFLTFGMYAYVPTLPDPYAANLNLLRAQFERVSDTYSGTGLAGRTIWLWLVSQTRWQPLTAESDQVDVSFHFAPLQNQFQLAATSPTASIAPAIAVQSDLSQHPFVQLFDVQTPVATEAATLIPADSTPAPMISSMAVYRGQEDYQAIWDQQFSAFQNDAFSLLDVSSNANQMGVSFALFGNRRMLMLRTYEAISADTTVASSAFPIQAKGLDVVAQGQLVRAFTTPMISWEPVINLTLPDPPGGGDPPLALNYYPDDGGPTRIMNNSVQLVPISPIPLVNFLVDTYEKEPDNITAAYFTLPFGLRSLAYLRKNSSQQPDPSQKPTLKFNSPSFDNDLKGGIQLLLKAGSGFNPDESNMFRGFTLQTNNVLDAFGNKTGASTLGHDVSVIFNGEFYSSPPSPDPYDQRGVPLTRIDLSGYGASTFSSWINKDAAFAETSQARFDVLIGRTAHEVIQVKSILYPWGIRVVRTITLFRVGSGYVYRFDSGWKAESDGLFDFRFKYSYTVKKPKSKVSKRTATVVPYKIHPGTIKGLFNIQNIKSALGDVLPFTGTMDISSFYELDPNTNTVKKYAGGVTPVSVDLQPVYFDADVELESVVQGQVGGRVPSKKILGFVQLAPRGIPLTPAEFQALLDRQTGSIGGPLDCVMDIGGSGQKFRVSRFDVNSSVDAAGTQPVFVAASRGSVVLPKDGSWSLVTHARGTGDVTPLPTSVTTPLIRIGELDRNMAFPDTDLLRIANPADLLRAPGNATINFGFLQSTNTQKVLFLTPAFAKQVVATTPGKLLSKTPPLFVDAYRLISSKAIFPNIGDAESTFGTAIALTQNFATNALKDGGKQVLELMGISSLDGINRLKDDGYKLLKTVTGATFDLPKGPWKLIDESYLKIYVEYAAEIKSATRAGSLDYDVNSFTTNVADRWKSLMSNMAMVVDLGPLKRLVTIKGNFAAAKGAEASFMGKAGDADFASPQIQFSDALQAVMDILQILEELQGGNYAAVLAKGLKLAMSNSPDSWEYKFEASKEIPVVKFPLPELDGPTTPLKLEASLKLGVYFNAALTSAAFNDPKKLLPTAGAFVEFYGRLSVMCVSLAAATVYAVGQVTLRIAGDTKVGPSLTMKFGFGAQIMVGLPVVGNVSVLYMVGVEIYLDSKTLSVSAFMLFQGNASLIGGLVDITITIEAKGTITRDSVANSTTCAVQVTFALDISLFLVIDISFSKSWEEQRQIA